MKNILAKLWLWITGLVVVILTIFWFFNIYLLDRFYLDNRVQSLYEKGETISKVLESQDLESLNLSQDILFEIRPDIDDDSSSEEKLEGIRNGGRDRIERHPPEILYYISLEDISAISHNGKDAGIPGFIAQNFAAIEESMLGGDRFSRLITFRENGQDNVSTLLIGVPVEKGGKLAGFLLLHSLSSSISMTTLVLKKQFGIITLISILASSLFAFFLAKHFTRPILSIKAASDEIAKGKYGVTVDVGNKDEIGLLAGSINRMSSELSKIEELRKDLIANVTHEFKTPLSVIKTYAEMINDMDIDDKDAVIQDTRVILDETDRLSSMVGEIIYLSRIQSESGMLSLEPVRIADLFDGIKSRVSHLADSKGVKLETECSEDIGILADTEKIFRCILNFVVNSINYTPPGNSVHLFASSDSSTVTISIRDEGSGISPEDLVHVWERFYKADRSRAKGIQGTGLGMTIAKDILDMHGFEYGIESEMEKGTLVYIKAPVRKL
ncbi:alkaline phosphatase synthesis sensor protein PhoR (plasmid) [Peptoclostridium acidaminophilum DSM 3953]|uniref:histidine kinase n=1 Tax=Peptoclostridium acidaminophilum DSM 3953 TaxID=1286171 RepID=W8TAQ3_PEPAC|nr:HAMP domain-containing sensor histidine kinase [Peptoclostridium acidaminophilum]AHM57965.1 alkaline phosphatase synthesis sensor protein PhoR [Peptoclostridium acidaminophilum DSM 3953]